MLATGIDQSKPKAVDISGRINDEPHAEVRGDCSKVAVRKYKFFTHHCSNQVGKGQNNRRMPFWTGSSSKFLIFQSNAVMKFDWEPMVRDDVTLNCRSCIGFIKTGSDR